MNIHIIEIKKLLNKIVKGNSNSFVSNQNNSSENKNKIEDNKK